MKKVFVILLFCINVISYAQSDTLNNNVQNEQAFKHGEWLEFRMSYSNFLNAGYSTISVSDTMHGAKEAFHINGFGKSTGLISLFFKVRDNYQSYMYKETLQPYRFIRKINEGGHIRDKEILFDYDKNEATVLNHKRKTENKYPISSNIQDMMSTLYYLRNQNFENIQVGDELEVKMFFDQEINNFKLRFLGKETIKVGLESGKIKVKALKFRPMVQAGRVFKEEESLTVWVSDDQNKIPLRIKASLAVGSLRADLYNYKGLAHPFNIIFDN